MQWNLLKVNTLKRCTELRLQVEKNRAHHKNKKNIAIADCLLAGYSITRQSVIATFSSYFW